MTSPSRPSLDHKENTFMRRALPIALVILSASPFACTRPQPRPTAPRAPAISVETAMATVKPMPGSLLVTGSLVANRRADVAANASGLVIKTFVDRGSYVTAGTALVQVDTKAATLAETEARANLRTAQTQLELSKSSCARRRVLFEQGAITREDWERASTQCQATQETAEAARARAELAAKALADATVRAPFAGTIGQRFVGVGEYVQPATRVVELVELSPLRLQFGLGEADVARVHPGQQIRFEVEAFPGEQFAGIVKYLDPSVRAASRDMVVEAVVENADRRLRPGMFVSAQVRLPDEPVVVVPSSAIVRESEIARLFVVVNGGIEERLIQAGAEVAGDVAVLDGLKSGERVVLHPNGQVRDGVPVK